MLFIHLEGKIREHGATAGLLGAVAEQALTHAHEVIHVVLQMMLLAQGLPLALLLIEEAHRIVMKLLYRWKNHSQDMKSVIIMM